MIHVDHRTGTVRYGGNPFQDGETIRVPQRRDLYVCVTGTNTAAYTYTVGTGAFTTAPEVAALSTFMASARPTLTDLLSISLPSGPPSALAHFSESFGDSLQGMSPDELAAALASIRDRPDAEPAADRITLLWVALYSALENAQERIEAHLGGYAALDTALNHLDSLLVVGRVTHPDQLASPGLRAVEDQALRTIHLMRANPQDVASYRDSFAVAVGTAFECAPVLDVGRPRKESSSGRTLCTLTALPEVLDHLGRLQASLPEVQRKLGTVALLPDVLNAQQAVNAAATELAAAVSIERKDLVIPDPVAQARARAASAEKMLAGRADLIKSIATIETLSRALLEASPVWESRQPFQVRLDQGREVTVTVVASTNPTLARAAVYDPVTVKVQAVPSWPVRPAASLSLVWAPGATYEVYEVQKPEGVEVVGRSPTPLDGRFTYTLDLALTYPLLDRRDVGGITWWLPVLSANPLADSRAVGIGIGASYGPFRLGTGLLWTRHQRLINVSPGQAIPAPDVRWRESVYFTDFGRPYVSLSVMGWPAK